MRPVLILAAALVSTQATARGEDREVPAFTAVHVSAGIRATVEIGRRKAVHIDADDAVLPLVVTEVEDGELKIHYKPNANVRGEHRVQVSVQTPQLHAVSASGGSIVRASFTRADRSDVEASGGSEVSVRGVDAGKLGLQASGGSILEVSGRADAVHLQLSGGSQLHGRDFSARDADVQGSGGSQAELKATGTIRGGLSGGSQLHVTGGASTRVATSGGSEVSVD
jgi:hypothetical protein